MRYRYFQTQATTSILLIIAVSINLLYSRLWTITKIFNSTVPRVITLALTIKLGWSPLYFWVAEFTRYPSNSRVNLTNMTKTCTLVSVIPRLTIHDPKPSIHSYYDNWIRQTIPNTTMKKYNLFINCSYRVNKSHSIV